MKSILLAFFLAFSIVSCNNTSEQNTTAGSSEDSGGVKASDTISDTSAAKGPGVDNSGGTPKPVDSATIRVNTRKNRALKK